MGYYPDDQRLGTAQAAAEALVCCRCGDRHLSAETITTAFWRDCELVVIRGIPALVCAACREEHITVLTARTLDRLRETGFAASAATERIEVPVFHFPVPVRD